MRSRGRRKRRRKRKRRKKGRRKKKKRSRSRRGSCRAKMLTSLKVLMCLYFVKFPGLI